MYAAAAGKVRVCVCVCVIGSLFLFVCVVVCLCFVFACFRWKTGRSLLSFSLGRALVMLNQRRTN